MAGDVDKPLRLLARRHDVVAVRLRDPRTRELPTKGAGLLRLRDPETGAAVWADTSSRRLREAYTQAMTARDDQLRTSLRRARIDILDLAPENSLVEPIMKFFRMREMRGAHG